MADIYDVIVVGGGPAGMSSALYTSRNKLKTLLIDKSELGGQLLNTENITNYIGSGTMDSWELAEDMAKQIIDYGVELKLNTEVTDYKNVEGVWHVELSDGQKLKSKTIILATGTTHKILPQLEHIKDYVSYCAVCDAEFQKDLNVAVVGAGDTAYESALMISEYANSVSIYIRSKPRAKMYLQELVNKKDNIHLLYEEIETGGIIDGQFMIEVGDKVTMYDNIFVCIGSVPQYIKEYNQLPHKGGYISLDMRLANEVSSGEKDFSVERNVFMAGDMIHPQHRQVSIAVGDGAIAGLQATEAVMKWNNLKTMVDLRDPLTQYRTKN